MYVVLESLPPPSLEDRSCPADGGTDGAAVRAGEGALLAGASVLGGPVVVPAVGAAVGAAVPWDTASVGDTNVATGDSDNALGAPVVKAAGGAVAGADETGVLPDGEGVGDSVGEAVGVAEVGAWEVGTLVGARVGLRVGDRVVQVSKLAP